MTNKKSSLKSVGIVNYHYSNHNYGAVLQAAALHNYIEKEFGYKSEHIDFIPKGVQVKWYDKLKSKIKAIMMEVGLKDKKLTHDSFDNSQIFQDFRNDWLPISSKKFQTLEELCLADLNYSHVIVGSDQVWRPSYTSSSSLVYFLAFLPPNVKKISYAASFGNDYWELNEEETKRIAAEIQTFDAISVREKSGVDICKNTFNVNAVHVLDPTLLIGRCFFDEVIGSAPLNETSEIVYYKLDVDDEFEKFIGNAATALNLKKKNIYYSSKGRLKSYRPVADWLRSIKESRMVITDSFHCVCFAILFEVPFLYYPNDNRGLTRLESLLTLLGLTHHIFRGDSDPVGLTQKLMKVDYYAVNIKLNKLRSTSKVFLANALV